MTTEERREYYREYRKTHKEQLSRSKRRYYYTHKDERLDYSRRYYANHKEQARKYSRDYYKANRAKIQAQRKLRRDNPSRVNENLENLFYAYNGCSKYPDCLTCPRPTCIFD